MKWEDTTDPLQQVTEASDLTLSHTHSFWILASHFFHWHTPLTQLHCPYCLYAGADRHSAVSPHH